MKRLYYNMLSYRMLLAGLLLPWACAGMKAQVGGPDPVSCLFESFRKFVVTVPHGIPDKPEQGTRLSPGNLRAGRLVELPDMGFIQLYACYIGSELAKSTQPKLDAGPVNLDRVRALFSLENLKYGPPP